MKKEKKSKKLDVKEAKDSKKESKKKNLSEEKKTGAIGKKVKSPTEDHIQSSLTVDYDAVKKIMIDSAVLYQSILVQPQIFNVNNDSYSLFPSEIKALNMIGRFSGINLTQLANKMGISKSAISKCTSKLLEKDLIKKEKSSINIREVVFTLSENGQLIFSQLESAHADLFKPFNTAIESLSHQEINELHHIFLNIHASLTAILDRF